MKYTNKYDFPEAIVRAVQNDDYTKGDSDYSVSGLITPVQESTLFGIHQAEIESDVSEEIWKLFGKAIHAILEQAHGVSTKRIIQHKDSQLEMIASNVELAMGRAEMIPPIVLKEILALEEPQDDGSVVKEERLYANIGGIILSGQSDWRTFNAIEDYKVTSVWKLLKGDYTDWTLQLNMYRYLAIVNGYNVDTLDIIGIFKDWKKYDYKKQADKGYPQHPVARIPIGVWKPMDILRYIMERIEAHEAAKEITDAKELAERFPCSKKERWQDDDTYALIKEGAGRAYRVFDNYDEALKGLSEKPEYKLETRQGTAKKCNEFCKVAQWCHQNGKPSLDLAAVTPITLGIVPKDVTISDLIPPPVAILTEEDRKEWEEPAVGELKLAKSLPEIPGITGVKEVPAGMSKVEEALASLKTVDTSKLEVPALAEHMESLTEAAVASVILAEHVRVASVIEKPPVVKDLKTPDKAKIAKSISDMLNGLNV